MKLFKVTQQDWVFFQTKISFKKFRCAKLIISITIYHNFDINNEHSIVALQSGTFVRNLTLGHYL